jgi:hypothetical protein
VANSEAMTLIFLIKKTKEKKFYNRLEIRIEINIEIVYYLVNYIKFIK